jgi:predicted NUDIX family NTP pyrophosphohydrolase
MYIEGLPIPVFFIVQSAGLLCFSVEPKTQNIFVLLGKETCFPDMFSQRGNWCSFAGKPNGGETVTETASREFTEECMACVRFKNDITWRNREYESIVHAMLENQEYYAKIEVTENNQSRVYFLKEIPWQADIIKSFSSLRTAFVRGDKDINTFPFKLRTHPGIKKDSSNKFTIDRHFLEKQCLKWWSVERLNDVVKNKGRYQGQRFQKSFLPVLEIMIERLKSIYL